MSYNQTWPRYKSSWLAALDCTASGSIKGRRLNTTGGPLYATFTVPSGEQLEAGDCIGMLRIPAGTTVIGGRLCYTALGAGVLIALGDPFACARFVGPCEATRANDLTSTSGTVTVTAGLDCGVIRKIGIVGDGCGIGYTYTCETDLVVSNLYSEENAANGGWAGGTVKPNAGLAGVAITGGTITVVLDVLPV